MNKKFRGTKFEIEKILGLYGLKSITIKPIKDGIINSSFFILAKDKKQYVLRVYQRGIRSNNQILNELQITAKFRQAGIPIPQTLKNLKGQVLTKFVDLKNNHWRAIVMEFIEGHHLKSNEYSLISEFAELQSKMHIQGKQIKPRSDPKMSFNKMTIWLRDEGKKALKKLTNKNLSHKYKNIIQDILFDIKDHGDEILLLPTGYVHLDYDSNNIIVSGRHIRGVLDFDDISYQPLVLDSAFSLWWWLFSNPSSTHAEILGKYLQGYTKHRKLNIMESQLFYLFIRMRNATLAALLFINFPKSPNLKSFKKAVKLDQVFKTLRL